MMWPALGPRVFLPTKPSAPSSRRDEPGRELWHDSKTQILMTIMKSILLLLIIIIMIINILMIIIIVVMMKNDSVPGQDALARALGSVP